MRISDWSSDVCSSDLHSTTAPKGVLLAHHTLIGLLPGFVASQNWFPQSGDIFWSPSGWHSAGGILNALLPTLYFDHAIVSRSEARREGKEWVSTCRSRWSRYH